MSDQIDIVDRLTLAIEQVNTPRAKLHEYTDESLVRLLTDARDAIHDLQGKAYAFPPRPSLSDDGTTWREEYEYFYERILKMTADEFLNWQAVMRD